MGARPSHPELLDYLAAYFVDNGWSMKQLHRLILLSNTYQQSSDTQVQAAEVDPGNKLLALARAAGATWLSAVALFTFES